MSPNSATPAVNNALKPSVSVIEQKVNRQTPSLIDISQSFHSSLAEQSSSQTNKHIDTLYQVKQPAARKDLTQQQRKAFRILRDLRRDVDIQVGNLKLPSAWVLRCLVDTHFKHQADNWNTTTYNLLKHLYISCENPHVFVDNSTQQNLFPTLDGFDLKDLRIFLGHSLDLLERQSYSGK